MRSDLGRKSEPPSGVKKLPLWLLAYAVCYAVFHILPAFMNIEVAHRLMIADLFDLLTPYVMVLLVGVLFLVMTGGRSLSRINLAPGVILILLGIVTFIEGHGMHLSANAIGRHLSASPASSLYALYYFFDEILGHFLWDAGLAIIAAGIILIGSNLNQTPAGDPFPWPALAGAPIYGFTYFVNAVEGQTVPFTFPLAVLLSAAMLWRWRRRKNRLGDPVYVMFLFAWLTAIGLFLIWGAWQGGFPEFSDLGWI